VLHETCIVEQNALEADKDTKCQAMVDAQVNVWEVASAHTGSKSCDFLADASGCSDFDSLEAWVLNLKGSISTARADYVSKTGLCNDATTLYDDKVQECIGVNGDYESKKSDCAGALSTAEVAICTFGSRFQEKCEKLDTVNALVTEVTDGSEATQSEASRIDEWSATQTVKCILQSYQEGGTFNEAGQATCTSGIDYAGSVGTMDYKATEITAQTTAEMLSCTETHITFSDSTWATGSTSADYVETTPYAVGVTLRPISATFASFC